MKQLSFLLILFTLGFCKPDKLVEATSINEENVSKIWRLTEINFNEKFYEESEPIDKRRIQGEINTGHILSLFSDGTATKLLGNDMEFMEWALTNANNLILKYQDYADTFQISKMEKIKGFPFMTLNIDSVGEYTFHQEHEMLKDVKTDPYHHSSNKWRITPDKFETKKELDQLMNNFLTHYKYLLSSASERPNSKIRLKHSLGILKIFDGGLGLKEEDYIPTDWLHSYFSDSQAVDMYKDINKHFRGRVIKGNQNDDWRIQNASILDSLIQFY